MVDDWQCDSCVDSSIAALIIHANSISAYFCLSYNINKHVAMVPWCNDYKYCTTLFN